MIQQDFSLAKVFSDLAKDPSWPKGWVCGWQLTVARLALMVVEPKFLINLRVDDFPLGMVVAQSKAVDRTLEQDSITPSHYANVKKRVEEAIADTESDAPGR